MMNVTGGEAGQFHPFLAGATSFKSATTLCREKKKKDWMDPLVQITNHEYRLLILHREDQLHSHEKVHDHHSLILKEQHVNCNLTSQKEAATLLKATILGRELTAHCPSSLVVWRMRLDHCLTVQHLYHVISFEQCMRKNQKKCTRRSTETTLGVSVHLTVLGRHLKLHSL